MANSTALCPSCGSQNLVQVIGSAPKPHYGLVECGDCGAWVRWLPNPAVSQAAVQREQIIKQALTCGRLSAWEFTFFWHIKERRHLSPKQEEKFQQICERHKLKTLSGNSTG